MNSQTRHTDNDNVSLLSERSLTEMLASDTPQPSLTSSPLRSQGDSTADSNDRIVLLESRLLASSIQLEGQTDENIRLKNVIQLLEKEIDSKKKTGKTQKNEIKKLKNENDELRRQLSRFRGMRKFADVADKAVATDGMATNISDTDNDELNVTKAKLCSLREHMVSITTSMLSALEHDDNEFQQVGRRRSTNCHDVTSFNGGQRQNQTYASVASNVTEMTSSRPSHISPAATRPAAPAATTARAPRPQVATSAPTGQPIPVVTLGLHRPQRSTPAPGPPDDSGSESVVIGSSLVKDIGRRLNKLSVNASCFVYRGATIPFLRDKVPNIINNKRPKNVILLCGGNDCERYPVSQVIDEYEKLISTVRAQCGPTTPIIVCKVPQRGNDMRIAHAIDTLNGYIQGRAGKNDRVYAVNVSPESPALFAKDKVHFNKWGKNVVAKKIASQMVNFQCHRPLAPSEWIC